MDFKIVIPVIISFVISVILAPVIIPFSAETESIPDGTYRRCEVPSFQGGNSDHGWSDLSDCSNSDIFALYKRLSEDHSDLISYAGIWSDRISG